MNNNTLKKLPLTLGLLCFAVLADARPIPHGPSTGTSRVAATADARVAIPQVNGSITGMQGLTFGDSQPYHLRGTVVYGLAGNNVVIKEIHVFGWSETNGHFPYRCGKFGINARHAWVNGRDVSRNLGFEASLMPQGWVASSLVARFPGNTGPVMPRGKAITVRADAAYNGGNCTLAGNFSISSSVVIR